MAPGSEAEDEKDNALASRISVEDFHKLKEIYDTNKDGTLSQDEILQMVHDYNHKKIKDPRILEILKKYDKNSDGTIDAEEHEELMHSLHLQETKLRYVGYTVGLSRLFRYLAFTSDFGEALRPVVHARIVTGSYAVAFAYCIADVGWETYKVCLAFFYVLNDKCAAKILTIILHVSSSS